MKKSLAIRLKKVSKIYRLHSSQWDILVEVLRLQRFGFKAKSPAKDFPALSNISLEVHTGQRIGIIGRNGAGKTTLLKLLCGNFSPTQGEVEVNGTVQALMSVGIGFHPEYSGRENVKASLQYNGIKLSEYQRAMEGIFDFCELGDFLDQPFKTYSLGMQARLMFATATAIFPDILIIDEVLGAGDAYFIAKSKARIDKVVSSGCTVLLVSHSMQHVMELCDMVIWMDEGKIRMQGEAFKVVKAYEEYLYGPIQKFQLSKENYNDNDVKLDLPKNFIGSNAASSKQVTVFKRNMSPDEDILLQDPFFIPHEKKPFFDDETFRDDSFNFIARGGVSRWDCEKGIKVISFSIHTENGLGNILTAFRPAKFLFGLLAEETQDFDCRYGIAIHDYSGICMTRIFSPQDKFSINKGETRKIAMVLNPTQIGPGDYTLSISVHENCPIEKINFARRYDLLSRSFSVKVELPDSLAALDSRFFQTAEWKFSSSLKCK